MSDPLKTESYDYHLPPELIATHPADPLDSAKLLIYDRSSDTITHERFSNILKYIPKHTEIILNNTKVVKARIYGEKSSGGKIELLLNRPLANYQYSVYIRGKVREQMWLTFDEKLSAQVLELHEDGSRIVSFYHENRIIDFPTLASILDRIGHVPLPPYINREDTKEDESNYQTLFAQKEGAVAAPTASLHFTPSLFEQLQQAYSTHYITLHVGAGTFKGVESENILAHHMHSEYYDIPPETANVLKSDADILAVGTTVTRTIEYFARVEESSGDCDLFLNPSNLPIRVNHLLTNFHLPKSTLIMLVASFIGLEKTLELYKEAVEKEYRFFSYGDAMLIL
jgi:S-adenosylmethionine:tRNA ribosyltransferase-isomerase